MDEWREQARALGIPSAGLVPQRHLEDWGVSGLQSSARSGPDGAVTESVTLSRMYTVWPNPDDRDDPVNRDADPEWERALAGPVPDDLPPWMLRQRERMRYPVLWEAVHTHWSASPSEERDPGTLLTAHVDHVLHNQFRSEYGLGDPAIDGWTPLVQRAAVQPGRVVVDGAVVDDGVVIDTDAFVVGVAAPLADGRVLTAVVQRDLLDLVRLEFTGDAADPR